MIDLNFSQKIIVKTLAGCEDLLAEELTQLGCKEVQKLTRAVMFDGVWEDIYRVNYCSRFALNVLVNITNFTVTNYDDIYTGASKVFWHQLMKVDQTFVIKHAIHSGQFTHTQLCALKVKDAIVDSFQKKYDKRPSVDKENPDFIFHIHISDSRCQLLVDTSGVSLYKRGYKVFQGFAPLNEIMAAAMVKWSGWAPGKKLVDPFCGSGTILIEAFMQGINRPAGYYRNEYAFMRFKDFDRVEWNRIKALADEEEKEIDFQLTGLEFNAQIVEGAMKNIRKAGAVKHINIKRVDFFKAEENMEEVIMVTNPPYGKRVEPMDESFFKNLSQFLKHHCAGSRVAMIAPIELVKQIGFKPSQKHKTFNGELECLAVVFDLFKGKKAGGSAEE